MSEKAVINLEGVILARAYLEEAPYNNGTKWPKGFDSIKTGAPKMGNQEPELDDFVT